MNFEFATARRILFGAGVRHQLDQHAQALGKRILLLTGRAHDRHRDTLSALLNSGQVVEHLVIPHEPDIDGIQALVAQARDLEIDAVVAIGGGSVLDAGKAVAALIRNTGALLDYLEGVGQGLSLAEPSLPVIAVPTTAGTGAEVTRNAVLTVSPHGDRPGIKVSLRSPHMLPTLALVDPELTYSMPPAVTATTGMDALTQCLEPFVSKHANPLTDGLAREGLTRAARSIQAACTLDAARNPVGHAAARMDMSIASLCGGLALANAKLGAVHGFAGVIGGLVAAPHGALCARLLPPVYAVNAAVLAQRGPEPLLQRMIVAAQMITEDAAASTDDAFRHLNALVDTLPIPRLSDLGVQIGQFPQIVAAAAKSSSMQGNPIEMTTEELTGILEEAY